MLIKVVGRTMHVMGMVRCNGPMGQDSKGSGSVGGLKMESMCGQMVLNTLESSIQRLHNWKDREF